MSLTLSELRRKPNTKCKHGHNLIEHPKCEKVFERLGFCDIEASNLTATFGIVYTYCILADDGELIKRAIRLKDLHDGVFDRNLVAQFIEDSKQFTKLIWHYGTDRRFDLPFLRTRATKWKLPFMEYKSIYVSDTYPILRNKFKLHSNRLETACDFFDIPAKKHKLNPDIWLNMITGNKKRMQKALDYILLHNVEDVKSLANLWQRISKYTKQSKTSI